MTEDACPECGRHTFTCALCEKTFHSTETHEELMERAETEFPISYEEHKDEFEGSQIRICDDCFNERVKYYADMEQAVAGSDENPNFTFWDIYRWLQELDDD